MKLLLNSVWLLAAFLCCQARNSDVAHDIDRLSDDLIGLEGALEDYLKHEKSEDTPLKDEAISKRAVTGAYECDFDGDCTKDFTITKEGTTVKMTRITNFHNRIQDKTTSGGGFIAAELRNPQKGHSAKMSHDIKISQATQCLEFSHIMYTNQVGCDIARFKVTLECGNESEELFRSTDSAYMRWTRVRSEIKKNVGADCKIVWSVGKGLSKNVFAAVGIDQVKMKMGACPPPNAAEPANSLTCNFDTLGYCDWSKTGSATIRFSGGGTNNQGTGPDRPYGYRSYPRGARANYFYVESRKSDDAGKVLSLTSPIVKTEATKQCMRFAFSMYGASAGSIEGYLVEAGKEDKEVFKKTGNHQGKLDKWSEGYITLPANTELQVKFRMTVGGKKSDLALDNIGIEEGECVPNKKLGGCESFSGNEENCNFVDDTCGEALKEFKQEDEMTLTRGNLLTTISKIAREWSVSVDIKPKGVLSGYTNILHFSTSKDCCGKGDRIPGLWFFSRRTLLLVATQVDTNGNYNYNRITLKLNEWTNMKMEQSKDAKGDYYYIVKVNDKEVHRRKNSKPDEYRNVKVFASDPWYQAANADIKNLVFKNEGEFRDCPSICNKPRDDPAYSTVKPISLSFPEERTLRTPTSSVRANWGTQVTTIPSMEKEWSFSIDVKMKSKVRGWSSIAHSSISGNSRFGDRIPGVFVISNTFMLHNTNQLGTNGNNRFNTPNLKQNVYTTLKYEQKKDADGKYYYRYYQDNVEKYKKVQTLPTTFENVKLWIPDRYYTPADADVKNVKFENLVAGNPCPGLCKGEKSTEKIDGNDTTVYKYTYETCKNKGIAVQVSLKPFTRAACMEMRYKVGKPLTSSMACDLRITRGDGRDDTVRRPTADKWVTVRKTLTKYQSFVGITGAINNRCSEVTVAGLKVTEGSC